MSVAETIEHKVREGLEPAHLDVINESHMHNVPANSETHFKLVVVADAFAGQMPVRRHKQIYALLDEELAGPVHALALHTYTPDEWQARGGQVEASPDCRGGAKNDPEFRS
jgi:BolA protein